MPLTHHLAFLRRNVLFLLVAAACAGGIAYLLTDRADTFTARSLVVLHPNDPDGADLVIGSGYSPPNVDVPSFVAGQVPVFTSPLVLNRASRTTGIPADDLESDVSVDAVDDAGNLEVTATADSRAKAMREANGVPAAYLDTRARSRARDLRRTADRLGAQADELRREIRRLPGGAGSERNSARDALQTQYADLIARRGQLLSLAELQHGDGQILKPATFARIESSRKRLIALGIVLGLIAGLAVALLREQLLDRARSRVDIEEESLASVIGEVPVAGEKARRKPGSPVHRRMVDALQGLWLRCQLNATGPVETVLVTSAAKDEGKTTIATELAAACAQLRTQVIFVSTDFRNPDGERRLGVLPGTPGLSDWLAAGEQDRAAHDVAGLLVATGVPNLRVMPSGNAGRDAPALLAHAALDGALARLKQEADIIIMDSPPALPVADALVLARHADATMVVVSLNQSSRRDLDRTLTSLGAVTENVGVVINRSRRAASYHVPVPGSMGQPAR